MIFRGNSDLVNAFSTYRHCLCCLEAVKICFLDPCHRRFGRPDPHRIGFSHRLIFSLHIMVNPKKKFMLIRKSSIEIFCYMGRDRSFDECSLIQLLKRFF